MSHLFITSFCRNSNESLQTTYNFLKLIKNCSWEPLKKEQPFDLIDYMIDYLCIKNMLEFI